MNFNIINNVLDDERISKYIDENRQNSLKSRWKAVNLTYGKRSGFCGKFTQLFRKIFNIMLACIGFSDWQCANRTTTEALLGRISKINPQKLKEKKALQLSQTFSEILLNSIVEGTHITSPNAAAEWATLKENKIYSWLEKNLEENQEKNNKQVAKKEPRPPSKLLNDDKIPPPVNEKIHLPDSQKSSGDVVNDERIKKNQNERPLQVVDDILKAKQLNTIKECECCPMMKRETKGNFRDQLDKKVLELVGHKRKGDTVTMLSVGPGQFKQELTISANLMANGYNVNWQFIEPSLFFERFYNPMTGQNNASVMEAIKEFKEAAEGLHEKFGKKCIITGVFSSIVSYHSATVDPGRKKIKQREFRDLITSFKKSNPIGSPDFEKQIQIEHKNPSILNKVGVKKTNLSLPDVVTIIDVGHNILEGCKNDLTSSLLECYGNLLTPHIVSTSGYQKTLKVSKW